VIRRGTRALAIATLAVIALVATLGACTPSPTPAPSNAAASPGALVSPIDGVPVNIEAEGFSKVDAFTIRTDDGRQLRFLLGPLENATQFPPQHLAEHLAGSTRIRVYFRAQGTDEVAYRLEDAPTP
jgi:hypothetical protein